MTGTLGNSGSSADLNNRRVIYAIILIVLLFSGFGGIVLYVHEVTHNHIYFFPLFPPLFLLTMMAALPLIFYVSYFKELKHLNPINPRDYFRLGKQTIQAINNNGTMKIEAKDL